MTQVNLKYRRIDGVSLDGALITTGTVTITPIARRDTTAGQMTTADLDVSLAASPPSVQLAGGTYKMRVRGPGVDFSEYRLVPASGGPFDVDDLDEVTPSGDAALAPEWKAYIDAAIAGVSVGSTTPASIVGSTAIGQALITAASQSSARSTIGAISAADLAAALVNAALSGNPTAPTPTAGDNDTSIATTAFVTAAIAALGTIISVPSVLGLTLRLTYRTTDVGATRPSVPSGTCIDWEVPGDTAPTNIRWDLGDVWTSVYS